jgi:hypothetical protein
MSMNLQSCMLLVEVSEIGLVAEGAANKSDGDLYLASLPYNKTVRIIYLAQEQPSASYC